MGKSASGKDTILNKLKNEGFVPLVSTTTRPMREGEIDGKDYNFISAEEFKKKIKNNDFIEYRSYDTLVNNIAEVWYYGLSKQEINPSRDYVTILDVDGTKSLLDYYGERNCFIVSVEADDKLREQRAMSRGSFDRSEWDRRFKDDASKFNNDEISKIANFRIYNEGKLENALIEFNKAYVAYKSSKESKK